MAESTEGREFDVGALIREVKEAPDGPEARAQKVYRYLLQNKELTNWDLICFCAEYVGSMVSTLPWIEEPARSLIRLVYLAHHVRFEGVAWLDVPILAQAQQSSSTKTEEPSE